MAPYVMTMIGMILVWNAAICSARPSTLTEDDSFNVIDTELASNDKGSDSPQVEIEKSHKLSVKAYYKLFEMARSSRKLAQKRRDNAAKTTEAPELRDGPTKTPEDELATKEASNDHTFKPVYGKDRILDQLLDHTGDKQPIHHSALDGWIF